MRKKLFACIISVVLVLQLLSIPVYAAPVSDKNTVIYFTNEDFVKAAETAYNNGELSEEDLQSVLRIFSARLGIKGENKIVTINSDTCDYYLNSLVWAAVTSLGMGAVATIIALIPGLSVVAATFIGSVVGSLSGSILSAERGVIIRIRKIDGTSKYVYEFISIREQ